MPPPPPAAAAARRAAALEAVGAPGEVLEAAVLARLRPRCPTVRERRRHRRKALEARLALGVDLAAVERLALVLVAEIS